MARPIKPKTQLTPKQERFAQCVAEGMSQSAAYRTAYDAAASAQMTVCKRASELMAKGDIAGRVKELRNMIIEKQLWSREDSIRELKEALDLAKNAGQITALTSAVKELNAMHGYSSQKMEHSGLNGGPIQVQKIERVIVDSKHGSSSSD